MRVTRWIVLPLVPKTLYKLGTLENDRFRFDSVPGIEMKPIFSRFSRAHFPIEMNKHKIGKITTQKFGLDISTLMYAS